MRALAFCLLCCLALLHIPAALALQEVRVGGYHFPPYLDKPESPYPQGLVPELLRALAAATQADTSFARQQVALGLARARLQQSLGILP